MTKMAHRNGLRRHSVRAKFLASVLLAFSPMAMNVERSAVGQEPAVPRATTPQEGVPSAPGRTAPPVPTRPVPAPQTPPAVPQTPPAIPQTPPATQQAPPVTAPPVLEGNAPQTLTPLGEAVDYSDFDYSPSDFLATRESWSASPTSIGDFLGGGLTGFNGQVRITTQLTVAGNILSGGPGVPSSIIGFDVGGNRPPDDIFTSGNGIDLSGDGLPDTFVIVEPLPTSDASTSPGQGFIFEPSTARATFVGGSGGQTAINGVFTDGENWFVTYTYVGNIGIAGGAIPLPGPGVAMRRIKIAENYSPDVRDRFIFNYNFFNDVIGNLGDVNRYTIGTERIVVDDLASVEFRLPLAGTYAAVQDPSKQRDRDFELGNMVAILKTILWRQEGFLWTGGVGVAFPTADDARLQMGGQDLLRVKNETVHFLPFTGTLHRFGNDFSIQTLLQFDIAANGDPIFGNLTGGTLPLLGEFNDSALVAASVTATKTIYRSRDVGRNRSGQLLRELLLNSELHYTGTIQDSDFISASGITYSNLADNYNVLNATLGMHIVLSNDLVITPAMAVPLRDGTDELFDYEAIVQMNYLR